MTPRSLFTRVATLGDLGEYLDPDGDSPIADEARDESIHQPGCAFGLPALGG
ncbi:hypothetical protein [Prauserella sp. PE36]|uniref:hypothetical protein n=1 Tax=Prauserella sp. PE36 TaxID=1504709 RepID=UPI001F3347CE|nr:hypothetical protein [Prauserella sp. PE36]